MQVSKLLFLKANFAGWHLLEYCIIREDDMIIKRHYWVSRLEIDFPICILRILVWLGHRFLVF